MLQELFISQHVVGTVLFVPFAKCDIVVAVPQ